MPDSSTGGFLVPLDPIASALALDDLIHDLIAGVTGLPGNMVRPKWQEDAQPQPKQGVDWCAFGVTDEGDNTIAGERHMDDGVYGYSEVVSHGPVVALTSFYGRNSQVYAKRLRMGLGLAQNREFLYKNEMALVEIGGAIHVPESVNSKWRDRWDVKITLRRRDTSRYAIRHLLTNNMAITTDGGLTAKR